MAHYQAFFGNNNFSRLLTLQKLVEVKNYTSYLELGCLTDYVFSQINVSRKIGVDNVAGGNFRGTTDEFFAQNTETFDLIFVDACHEYSFVKRDLENSLRILNENGTIVMHDTNPWCPEYELPTKCGDGWKAYVELKQRDDLEMICGDFDHGVGIIRRGNQKPLHVNSELNYSFLEANRVEILNLSKLDDVLKFIER